MNQKTKNILIISISILIIILLIFFGIKFFSHNTETKDNDNLIPKRHIYTKDEKLNILDKNKPQKELTKEQKKKLVTRLDSMMEKNKKAGILDKLNDNTTKENEVKKLEKLDLLKKQ